MQIATHEHRWLDVTPSMRMFYRDFDQAGPTRDVPVIGLHGYWRSSKDFIELAEHLSPRRRVILPDLRGRGQTSRSTEVSDYAFDRLLDDLKRLYTTLGIERAVLLGTALGAHLSLVLASTSPEMVAGLILNDTGVESASAASNKGMARYATADGFSFDEAVERIREQNQEQFPGFGHDEWVRMTLRAYTEAEPGVWVRDFDQLTNKIFPDLIARFPDFWTEYRAIGDIPVAILRGENSHFLPAELAQRMVEGHPDATLYTIPGSGHAPTLWEPEALQAVDDFLAKVDASK